MQTLEQSFLRLLCGEVAHTGLGGLEKKQNQHGDERHNMSVANKKVNLFSCLAAHLKVINNVQGEMQTEKVEKILLNYLNINVNHMRI